MAESKKVLNKLEKMYFMNLIHYSRINNTFIVKNFCDLMPHPSFPELNIPEFMPVNRKKLKVNKGNSLLILNMLNLATPSDCVGFENLIDKYFDQKFQIKEEKRNIYIKKRELYKKFKNKNQLSDKEILNLEFSIFNKNKQKVKNVKLFDVLGHFFIRPYEQNGIRNTKREYLNLELEIYKTSSLKEAIIEFKKNNQEIEFHVTR